MPFYVTDASGRIVSEKFAAMGATADAEGKLPAVAIAHEAAGTITYYNAGALLTDIKVATEAIRTAVEILDNTVSGAEQQVDVLTSALPTGAATAANQATIIGHVDGIEGFLATLAGAVAGTEYQVDVLSLPSSLTPGTAAGNLGKAEDAIHASGDTGVLMLGVRRDAAASGVDASGDYATINVDANGRVWVNAICTQTAPWAITTLDGSSTAHDAADANNPHKIGFKAGTADQTAVATGDRTDARSDVLGHQVVRPYALHENAVDGVTAAITTTTSTSVIAAGGAGIRTYITSLSIINSHATVGTVVEITDGSGGTVKWRIHAQPLGGGEAIAFPVPLRFTANTAVHAVCITTGANVYVSAAGYRAAV